jgi:hypothetical protein
MKAIRSTGRSRLTAAIPAIVLAVLVTSVVVGQVQRSQATTQDGDVELSAGAGSPCTPGATVNCASQLTRIVDGTGDGFEAVASGTGLWGDSTGGEAVYGSGATNGVHGVTSSSSDSGVWGENDGGGYGVSGSTSSQSETAGVWGSNLGSGPGVTGSSSSGSGVDGTGAVGVHGSGLTGVSGSSGASVGFGVYGSATKAGGIGVFAVGADVALKAEGRTRLNGPLSVSGPARFNTRTLFARSGMLLIPQGSSKGTRAGIALTSGSVVLATIQGNIAHVWIQGVSKVTGSSGSFTVHLNKAAPAGGVTVGWFVLN